MDGSNDDVDNALAVSFVEDFALDGFDEKEVPAILQRLSKSMHATLAHHSGQWRV